MAMFGTLARRLWSLVRRRQVDSGVDQEMGLHLALLEQQLRDGGMPRDQARLAARQRFGNSLRLLEETRNQQNPAFGRLDGSPGEFVFLDER